MILIFYVSQIPPPRLKLGRSSSDPGYVLYSAVGSFFAPMLVMIFLNWRIYKTAKQTIKAIRQVL